MYQLQPNGCLPYTFNPGFSGFGLEKLPCCPFWLTFLMRLRLEKDGHTVQHRGFQASEYFFAEAGLVLLNGRYDKAVGVVGSGWLYPEIPASLQQCLQQTVFPVFLRNCVFDQPTLKVIQIGECDLPEATPVSNLCTMILHAAAFPWIRAPFRWVYSHLICYECHRLDRHFVRSIGKSTFKLEKLQKNGKTEAGSSSLALDHVVLFRPDLPVM